MLSEYEDNSVTFNNQKCTLPKTGRYLCYPGTYAHLKERQSKMQKLHICTFSHILQAPFVEWRLLEKLNSEFCTKEDHFHGGGMDWGLIFPKAVFHLTWESAGSTSEQVSQGSFSFLKIQTSSALSSGSQHRVNSQSLWPWKSNTVHSERMRQHCLVSASSLPNALRGTFPTSSDRWKEECSPYTAPMVAFSWTTSLGLLSLQEREPCSPTVHICSTLWSRCMIGNTTLLSPKILIQRIWYIAYILSDHA